MSNRATFLILAILGGAAAIDWWLFDAALLTFLTKTLLKVISWLAFWR